MSLITRCPACQTSFRVVPDQLRMSEGWVRCGQCSDIFDASANLQASAGSSASEVDLNIDVHHNANHDANHDVEVEAKVDGLPTSLSGSPEREQSAVTDALDLQTALREVVASRAGRGDTSAAALEPHPSLSVGQMNLSDHDSQGRPSSGAVSKELADESPEGISFLEKAKAPTAKQKTWVKVALFFVSLVLLLGLLVQASVHERNRLASFFPDLKPHLQTLCVYLNCTVSTLKQIESIVVDNSTFSRQRGDTYRFGLVLKNTAAVDLAMPAVELTLTDSLDQPLLRKILTAAELGAKTNILAANAEWTGTAALSAKVNGGTERIAGYRVLAFYP